MKARIITIIAAVLIGILAIAGVIAYVGVVKKQVAEEGKQISVVIADKEIPAGTTFDDLIRNDMVSVKHVPKRYVAADAVFATTELKGKTACVAIGQGEQLTKERFESSQKSRDLKIRIKDSMRAIAIPYDEVKAVAGAISSGDLVDVVATFDKELAGIDTTKTILRNIEVLSVSLSSISAQDGKKSGASATTSTSSQAAVKKTVVLAVPAGDVEKLVFAEKKGTVWLTLVPAKAQTVPTSGQTVNSVLTP